jgi:hypothetical protein
MPDLAAIADGTSGLGDRWIIRAGGTAENFFTVLDVTLADGRRGGGGCGGPVLMPGEATCLSYGTSFDDGPMHVVGRADPVVDRLRLDLINHDEAYLDLVPMGDPTVHGVRFFAALLSRSVRPRGLTAFGVAGRVVERREIAMASLPLDRGLSAQVESLPEGTLAERPLIGWRPLPLADER